MLKNIRIKLETRNIRHYKTTLRSWMCGVALTLVLPLSASAATFEDYRFPRESSLTKDGYPTPLSGKPITDTPVIVKKEGASLKKYPEHYIPGKEPLQTTRCESLYWALEARLLSAGLRPPPAI